ncbi:hypothetical protein O6H91_22G021700 [Diphasiastrum complanatum]|uniref:Uncharacterized protein n=1 Tax=Diphasiastrum complanatum TaxID=34168 RepID=A0ACC2ADR9_DIPCM|nr:hypothetical protein O6H91_22G021700 [Diphasiastrum complanatum]
MEATQVNWDLLDALVLNYAEEEKLLVSVNDESFCEGCALRSTIQDIRALIELGNMTKAFSAIMEHAPAILDDNRLLFQLYKQEFMELLRNGSDDARNEAIIHSRMQLGPCALNAYPEAYEEFKRILLALIYDEHDRTSPVALEWSESRRAELAATVSSTLKAHLHAYDPPFSLMLRYLIRLHNVYSIRQGVTSPIAGIASEVLLKDRDPPASVQDSLVTTQDFSESDVQALAQAVDISRQAAVDSLRYTNGDLNTAMKNELSRMRVNVAAIDALVHEYCIYRGLLAGDLNMLRQITCIEEFQLDSTIDSTASTGSHEPYVEEAATMTVHGLIQAFKDDSEGNVADKRQCLGAVPALELSTPESECEVIQAGSSHGNESITTQHQLQKKFISDVRLEDKEGYFGVLDLAAGTRNNVATESHKNCSDCSTSKVLLTDRFNPWQKWKGRSGKELNGLPKGPTETFSTSYQSPQTIQDETKAYFQSSCNEMFSPNSSFQKYEKALRIRKSVTERMAKEAIEEIEGLLPNFFEQNPDLFFQLKQLEFLTLVNKGDLRYAIQVARNDLGPVAARFSEFIQPLKETLVALVHPKEELFSKQTLPTLMPSLQVALNSQLGIIEPKLIKIVRVTLYMHTEWFKLQRCSDPFGDLLKINALKEIEAFTSMTSHRERSDVGAVSCSRIAGTPVSSRPSEGSITQQSNSSHEQAMLDEASILTISEWLALSRADAIQLLAQYDGSVDSVFEHLMT